MRGRYAFNLRLACLFLNFKELKNNKKKNHILRKKRLYHKIKERVFFMLRREKNK